MTWKEICNDPVVAELPYRIESDEWGNVLMSPLPGMNHSRRQGRIAYLLGRLLRGGSALSEFPLQTAKGVKAIDTVWISHERIAKQPRREDVAVFAPEICVEVYSPRNRRKELEKKRPYFEKGALECWTCNLKGNIAFSDPTGPILRSKYCPKFPTKIELE